MKTIQTKLSYKDAGVDIEQADRLVRAIAPIAKRTHRTGVLNSIGGFGALFEVPIDRYRQPVLVSGTDGVGTKLKLAIAMKQHDTIGIDLVAMCANDILTLGAEPLFFLDYFATGKLEPEEATAILRGIGKGCELANAALIGGETAEMPGVYHGNDYDLAGFCVGVAEKENIIDGRQIEAGNQLVAIASSGVHSNGYSLVRKILEKSGYALDTCFENSTLGEVLLKPTEIYVTRILKLLKTVAVRGIVHITGGGLPENMPRILPKGLVAKIHAQSWQWPAIFQWLQTQGNIDTPEMQRTFNLGIGMIVVVAKNALENTLQTLGKDAWHVGEINAARGESTQVVID